MNSIQYSSMRKAVTWVVVALVVTGLVACLLALLVDREDENDLHVFQDAYKQPIRFAKG